MTSKQSLTALSTLFLFCGCAEDFRQAAHPGAATGSKVYAQTRGDNELANNGPELRKRNAAASSDEEESGLPLRFCGLVTGKTEDIQFFAVKDKALAMSFFNSERRQYGIKLVSSPAEAHDYECDVLVRMLGITSPQNAEVVSLYSNKVLMTAQSQYKFFRYNPVTSVGTIIFDALAPGTEYYNEISSERSDYRKKKPSERTQVAATPVATSDVDQPKFKDAPNPDSYAVVIGIEKYAALPEAQFAERDARAVKAHLLAMGYPQRNVVMLTGQQATKSGMEKYLESWLPANATESSRVFVYFSGHGAPDVQTGGTYLVPADGDVKYISTTGYPLKRMYAKLNELKAKNIVVALDSCFSGAGGRSVLPKGVRPLVTRLDLGAQSVGKVVALSASAPDEVAGTADDQGHGLFTYYLLKGLGGAAANNSGKVTAQSLHRYLTPNVQDRARQDNREQTPQLQSLSGAGADFQLR